MNGSLAGALAALCWWAQQPLDKRVFGFEYDDAELLGKAVTRGPRWRVVGVLLHLATGAAFGAVYAAVVKPLLPGPAPWRGVSTALAENFATWPLTPLVHRVHPARRELPRLAGSRRALAQATWRHALFGFVLSAAEDRLNRTYTGDRAPE